MVSALYILSSPELEVEHASSEILLHRAYLEEAEASQAVIDAFDKVYKRLRPEERTPFLHTDGLNYIYLIQPNDIIVMVVTRRNINAMEMILFLQNFLSVVHHYLNEGSQCLDKDTIIDNIYFIYELLDECMDLGMPQNTDYNILKEYIKISPNKPTSLLKNGSESASDSEDSDEDIITKYKSHRKQQKKKSTKKLEKKQLDDVRSTHNHAINAEILAKEVHQVNSAVLRSSSSAINWRPKGIFYTKNEIYIDMIEDCYFLFDLESSCIIRNEVFGRCFVKCYLSGMPVCTLGFNESQMSALHNEESSVIEEHSVIEEPTSAAREGNQLTLEESDNEDEGDNESELLDSGLEATDVLATKPNQKKKHIPFRSIQFHQSVELDSVYKENLLKFIPPDDQFLLMSYHIEQQRQRRKLPLVMIKPTYRINKDQRKLQIMCILSTNFKKRFHCKNLIIKLPINPLLFLIDGDQKQGSQNENLKYKAELGSVNYKIDSSEVIWTIEDLNGRQKSVKMMAELTLSDEIETVTMKDIDSTLHNRTQTVSDNDEYNDNEEAKRELDKYYGVNGTKKTAIQEIQKQLKGLDSFNHIKMSYNIPMLSYSGLKLNYLKVEEDQLKYTTFPWVRYVTKSDSFEEKLDAKDTHIRHNYFTGNSPLGTVHSSGISCTYRFKLAGNCFQMGA